MRERFGRMGAPALAFAMASAFSPTAYIPRLHTVSSFTIHRGRVDRTFVSSATAQVSNAELDLALTVKGSLLDLATGADVVNSSGSVVSGSRADIGRRQGGDNTQIDVSVAGLTGKPPGDYRVRIHYAVEANGPDIVKLRLLERGSITSITRDATTGVLGAAYGAIGQTSTFRVTGTGLAVATMEPITGATYTLISRSNSTLVFTLRPTKSDRFYIFGSGFYDENLGHVPTLSEDNELGVRYQGFGAEFFVVAAPAVTSVTPQPASASRPILLTGSNLTGGGLNLASIGYAQRYAGDSKTLVFAAGPTSVTFAGAYDIASGSLELNFHPTSALSSGTSAPPDVTVSVPFSAAYAPTMTDVLASAEQTTVAGVRVLRAGSVTFTGKYLFTPTATGGALSVLARSPALPVVRLGSQPLTVTATRYVAPTSGSEGRDSLRVTLPDLADNVAGQFTIETDAGSATAPTTFVLATKPHVSAIANLTDRSPVSQPPGLATTLTRGMEYVVTGTALSVKNGAQVLQTGTVRIGSRAMSMESTPDPAVQLRFVVPLDATGGPLVVSSLGGESSLGTVTVVDAPPRSIPVPRPKSVTVSPASVVAGVPASGVVTLDNPAETVAGFTVALTSDDRTVIVPATVRPTGTSVTFPITTIGVSAPRTVRISATSGGATETQSITVTPAVPTTLSLSAIDIVAGATVNGTLAFTAAAPGSTAALTSSDPAVSVPASVPVVGTSATFSVTTTEAPAPRTVTISGTANGVTKTATVTVTPLVLRGLSSSSQTLHAGERATITVGLNRGPATNEALTIASSNPSLLQFDAATLTVASGQLTGTIGIHVVGTPTAQTQVTITVSRSVVTAAFGTITTSAHHTIIVAP